MDLGVWLSSAIHSSTKFPIGVSSKRELDLFKDDLIWYHWQKDVDKTHQIGQRMWVVENGHYIFMYMFRQTNKKENTERETRRLNTSHIWLIAKNKQHEPILELLINFPFTILILIHNKVHRFIFNIAVVDVWCLMSINLMSTTCMEVQYHNKEPSKKS